MSQLHVSLQVGSLMATVVTYVAFVALLFLTFPDVSVVARLVLEPFPTRWAFVCCYKKSLLNIIIVLVGI